MLAIYRDITDACDKVIDKAKEAFSMLGYSDINKDTISIQEVIEVSQSFHWKWNFLFVEWFDQQEKEYEEEAN